MASNYRAMTLTKSDSTAMTTIPTLCQVFREEVSDAVDEVTYLQLKWPSDILDKVCPPRIQLRIQKPIIEHKLKTAGIVTPKYLNAQVKIQHAGDADHYAPKTVPSLAHLPQTELRSPSCTDMSCEISIQCDYRQ